MDSRRFDDLTRLLAGGRSRRQVLKGLVGVALGGLAAGHAVRAAAAPRLVSPIRLIRLRTRCRPNWPACGPGCCPPGLTCVNGQGCAPAGSVPCAAGFCPAGLVCLQDRGCAPDGSIPCGDGFCPPGLSCAGGRCTAGDPCAGINCDDGNPCTQDSCQGGTCIHQPIAGFCTSNADCNDGNPCTSDACVGNTCQHEPVPDCCRANGECDDGDPCTADTCVNNACAHNPIAGCCPPGEEASGEACYPPCPEGQTRNAATCACECSGFQDGCAPHEVCRDGVCVAACNPIYRACPDANGVPHCGCNPDGICFLTSRGDAACCIPGAHHCGCAPPGFPQACCKFACSA